MGWTLTEFNTFVPPQPNATAQVVMEALLFCHRQIRDLGIGQSQQRDLLQQWFGKIVAMAGWVQDVATQQELLVQTVCRLQGAINDQLLDMFRGAESKANEAFDLAQRIGEATQGLRKSLEDAKGWPGWAKMEETASKVRTLEAQVGVLGQSIKGVEDQMKALTAQIAAGYPEGPKGKAILVEDVQGEVAKAETRCKQYLENRLLESERHLKEAMGASKSNGGPALDLAPKVTQMEGQIAQLRGQAQAERDEFTRALAATRLRAQETEKALSNRISRLESQVARALSHSRGSFPQEGVNMHLAPPDASCDGQDGGEGIKLAPGSTRCHPVEIGDDPQGEQGATFARPET
ncbi:hypothetical protein M569_17487, partial [Genlisea aurea]